MEDNFTIKIAYQLSAIGFNGERLYYVEYENALPSWSVWASNTYFRNLRDVPKLPLRRDMMQKVSSVQILEVEMRARVVDVVKLEAEARAHAEEEIERINRELNVKLSSLGVR